MIFVGVIQARMGSTRLPGKVIRPLAGRPVLAWVVRAALESGTLDEVIVATTTDQHDDVIARLSAHHGARVFRGAGEDVLARFVAATEHLDPTDYVVRFTADNPLVDPALVRLVVKTARDTGADYIALTSAPNGVGVSASAVGALRRANAEATGFHRAHVTSYLYSNPKDFRLVHVPLDRDTSDIRVTLDTPADAEVLDAVVTEFGDQPVAWQRLVEFLRQRPDIFELNSHIQQKPAEHG